MNQFTCFFFRSFINQVNDGNASAATVSDATRQCEIIALATPWTAAEDAIRDMGDISGKILIDCTNPIGEGLSLTHAHTTSGGEQVAEWASQALIVKSFNSTGWENMANSDYGSVKPTMFLCGDDSKSKTVVPNSSMILTLNHMILAN